MWQAVDEYSAELDVLVQKRCDKAAAKRCFRLLLRSNPVPRKIVTGQWRSYPAAKAVIHEIAHVKHVVIKEASRVNDRAEIAVVSRRSRRRARFFPAIAVNPVIGFSRHSGNPLPPDPLPPFVPIATAAGRRG